jgi:hypothetical protein
VLGLRGERSQSTSRMTAQRSVCCSRQTRPTTRTHCQHRPTVSIRTRALTIGAVPAPLKLSLIAGATIQARMPIGRAAAAHTATI